MFLTMPCVYHVPDEACVYTMFLTKPCVYHVPDDACVYHVPDDALSLLHLQLSHDQGVDTQTSFMFLTMSVDNLSCF